MNYKTLVNRSVGRAIAQMSRAKNDVVAHVHAFGVARGLALLATSTLLRRPRLASAGLLPLADRSILLRAGTSDPQVFMEVMTFGEYEFPYPTPVRTIVDLGAHIGMTAVWFAERYPDASVLAVEPDDDNFELLVANTRGYPNIAVRKSAVWSTSTSLTLVDPGAGSWSYYTRPAEVGPRLDGSEECDDGTSRKLILGCTVAQLLDEAGIDHIDLLKVDIEGAENAVFADPDVWISRVGAIVIELHDDLIPGTTETFDSATAAFPKRLRHRNTTMVAR